MKRLGWCTTLLLFPLLTGCGSGVQEAIGLAAQSGTRTFVDILLSDLLADLPDLFSFSGDAPDGGDGDPDAGDGAGGADGGDGDGSAGDGDAGDGDGDGGGTDLAGVAADGETVFTDQCSACHCGGTVACEGSLLDVAGSDFDSLFDKLIGGGFHGGGAFPDLTDQDLADLEAFLAQ